MKFNSAVSNSARKSRKAYFTSDSETRRKFLSAHLAKDQRVKYNVRALPVRKNDIVKIVRGDNKGIEGKVLSVYRKKFAIYIERVEAKKANGSAVKLAIHPSNVLITNPHLDKDRLALIARKAAGRGAGNMSQVD